MALWQYATSFMIISSFWLWDAFRALTIQFLFWRKEKKTLSEEEIKSLISSANALQEEGRLKAAISKYDDLLKFISKGNPFHEPIMLSLGVCYRLLAQRETPKKNLAKAIRCWENLIKARGSDKDAVYYAAAKVNIGSAYVNLAQSANPEKNILKSIQAFQDALRIFSPEEHLETYIGAKTSLAQSYLLLGQHRGSLDEVTTAIDIFQELLAIIDPEESPFEYAMIQSEFATIYEKSIEIHLRNQDHLAIVKAFNKAISILEKALEFFTSEKHPEDNKRISKRISNILEILNDTPWDMLTIHTCQDAATGAELLFQAIFLLYGEKRNAPEAVNLLRRALKCFAKATKTVPHNPATWCYWGEALYHLDKPHDALEKLERAIELDPSLVLAWYGKSMVFTYLDDVNSTETLAKALELSMDYPTTLVRRARELISQDNPEQALEPLARATKLESNYATAWYLRGEALLALRMSHQAITMFEKATDLKPRSATAWLCWGEALLNLRKPEEAIEKLEIAVKFEPDAAAIWQLWGEALSVLGEDEEASAKFNKAEELNDES
ncbi:MAG: tetratricopeptide repeat protein [Candidatus Heimdallarchaeota archaeon]